MVTKRLFTMLSFIAVLAGGCASTSPVRESLSVWPAPPETPRIAFVGMYRGEADFRNKSFFDSIFGAPALPGMVKPYGVFSRGSVIYVADSGKARVFVIDVAARKVTYVGEEGRGKLQVPLDVAVSSDGTIYVSDSKLQKVLAYDASGTVRFSIGKGDELKNPSGIAINDDLRRIYIVDSTNHLVRVYTLEGTPLFQFGVRGEGDGELNFPTNVAIDRRNGNVCIVDTANFRVQIFSTEGKFLRKFGVIGDMPGTFSRPKGIGIDSEGHIYVSDAAFSNFQVFDDNGQLLLFIGQLGRKGPGEFILPAGVHVDEDDRIVIADQLNGRVQVFQYLSEKWKKTHPEEYKKYLPAAMGL